MNRVICTDARHALPLLLAEGERYDSIVMDLPGALNFMGEPWDTLTGPQLCDLTRDLFIAATPGCGPGTWAGVWAHAKTSHWTAVGIEEAGWLVEHKVIWLNPEGRIREDGLSTGHEEWILARLPGPMRPLNIDLWREATTEGREPRDVLIGLGYGAVIDKLVGSRRSGAISSVRAADKDRSTYGGFNGTETAKAAAASEGGASRYFPSWEKLMLLYAPRARHSHRELTPGGQRTTHRTAKSVASMLPIVDLVSGTGGRVLDATCGSGATLAAAEALGLACTGIEWMIDYAQEAALRLGVGVEDWRRR